MREVEPNTVGLEASVGLVLAAMKQAFPREPLPNVTAVGVNWLAGFQFEAKVIARIPQEARR